MHANPETELLAALSEFSRATEAAAAALARAGEAMARMGAAMQDAARVREELALLARGLDLQAETLAFGGDHVPMPSGLLVPPEVRYPWEDHPGRVCDYSISFAQALPPEGPGPTFLGYPITFTDAPGWTIGRDMALDCEAEDRGPSLPEALLAARARYYEEHKPELEARHLQYEFAAWRGAQDPPYDPTPEQEKALRRMHAIAGDTAGQLFGVSQVPLQ